MDPRSEDNIEKKNLSLGRNETENYLKLKTMIRGILRY